MIRIRRNRCRVALLIAFASAGCSDGSGISEPEPEPEAAVALEITTDRVPNGQVGVEYRAELSARGGGGRYLWFLPGASPLPPGLSLSTTGVISGTPATAGWYGFTVAVTSDDDQVVRRVYQVEID